MGSQLGRDAVQWTAHRVRLVVFRLVIMRSRAQSPVAPGVHTSGVQLL
jgi:hypothetical protein